MAHEETTTISRDSNRIIIGGTLGMTDYLPYLATVYNAVHVRGYQGLILDFSQCTAAFAGPMLAICAQVLDLRSKDIDFEVVLPHREKLGRLFKNANWAHLLDPVREKKSAFKGFTQVPATQFISDVEQSAAVNRFIDAILSSMMDLARSDFAAMEWSLNELTDNVLTHSQSAVGGLVQLTTFERTRRRVEFAVCDAGIGIPASLGETDTEVTSDVVALDRAIREGVTKDKTLYQGNGLFGTFQVCQISRGYFQLHSGYAQLTYKYKSGMHIRPERIPYAGVLIVAGIDCSEQGVLENALRFGGRPHTPVDFIEIKYELEEGMRMMFRMKDETTSFGSRIAGQPVRMKLENLAKIGEREKIIIDFSDIPIISSSFADEVFGKLFVKLKPVLFMHKFDFVNISDTVRSLIDRAIAQRSSTDL